jgi:hypothetical protein
MTLYNLNAEQLLFELAQLELILDGRSKAAHRLAKEHVAKEKDPAFAAYFKEKSDPASIKTRMKSIQFYIKAGDLDAANQWFRRLRNDLQYIAQDVRRPHIIRGFGTLRSAKEGHERVYGTKAQKIKRWQAIAADLQAELDRGTKKTAAYEVVAEKRRISSKTVVRAIGYLKKLKKS